MAKKASKRNSTSKRRVIRRSPSSNSTISAKKPITSAASFTAAATAKKKGFLGWLRTPAVPPAKGIAKFAPKHVFKVFTSKKALKLYAIALLTGFLAVAAIFAWFAKDLPSPNKINAIASAQTTKLFDRTGTHLLVEIYGDKNRSVIEFNQMPKCIKDSTVALEDKDFYSQGAFSPKGLARAFTGILFKDSSKGGGSTITQQYVKNALLTNERSFSRKIKELILSIEIEQLYKKDDILKLYLNEIPYGSTAYGIQAGSKQFFGVDAKDLTLSQCALLASLPQAPSYYSPYGTHKEQLVVKKDHVLDLMEEQGYISKDEATQAKSVDVLAQLKPYNPYANVTAPHFVQFVREQLEEKYGVKQVNEGGLKVITTLDVDKQKQAEAAVVSGMNNVRSFGGSNAALVSADPKNGQVLTMVGSYDYNEPNFGSFNLASANRQPGSSIKPLVYSNLFKKNWGPGSTVYDVKTDFGGGYSPKNYTNRFYGVQSIRTSLSSSLNIPAVKALYLGGIDEFIATAKEMGITTFNRSTDDYGLSLALGSGEVKMVDMANAFSVLADEGVKHNQVYWTKITDSNGKTVDEVSEKDDKGKSVLDPQIAFEISSILSDNSARCSLGVFTCNNPLTLGNRPVAAKTGTTEDYKDAWTVGYTPQLVTVVWAGNNDNKPMTQAASIVSAPIWNSYMKSALADAPVEQFKQPAGIKQVTLDANTGKAPVNGSRTRTDIFASWYQLPPASNNQSATIDIVSGKLATACTPADARKDITGALITAELPPTDISYPRWNPPVQALAAGMGYGSGGSTPTLSDDVHQCGDAQPSVTISATPAGSEVTVTATAAAGRFPLTRVDVYRDGNLIRSYAGGTFTDDPGTGSHSYYAKVYDSGYYTSQSNTVSTNVSGGGYTLNCTMPKTCILSGLSSGSATLFFPGGSQVDNSSPYSWINWAGGGASNWNGTAGPGSNVYASIGSTTVYP